MNSCPLYKYVRKLYHVKGHICWCAHCPHHGIKQKAAINSSKHWKSSCDSCLVLFCIVSRLMAHNGQKLKGDFLGNNVSATKAMQKGLVYLLHFHRHFLFFSVMCACKNFHLRSWNCQSLQKQLCFLIFNKNQQHQAAIHPLSHTPYTHHICWFHICTCDFCGISSTHSDALMLVSTDPLHR